MKKLERLAWIQRTFGINYVQGYWTCRTWKEIEETTSYFENDFGFKWGLRTDTVNGTDQGYQLPFLFNGTLEGARVIWNEHREKLIYIVTERLPIVRLHGVALRVAPEYVFIEWNEREKDIAQRHMYRHPENLRSAVFGPGSQLPLWGAVRRVINPRHTSQQRFLEVYRLMLTTDVEELTFSVKPNGQVIIW